MSIYFEKVLRIHRCPHCNVDSPNMIMVWENKIANSEGGGLKMWRAYACQRCGNVVTAFPDNFNKVAAMFPQPRSVDDAIPTKAGQLLHQAIQSLHAPAGAVMLAASAVDAMLKDKKYTKGSLYDRINEALTDHLITKEMSDWAHQVRLDANDQRHADENASLPTSKDAQRSIEFAEALGQFLFVLPAMVTRGLKASAP